VLAIERYGAEPNSVVGSVELEVGSMGLFHATHRDLDLRIDELAGFRDQLRELDRVLTGTATLEHHDGQLGATFTLDKGKGTLCGFVRELAGASLEFKDVATDQSYVRQALAEFDAVIEAFPVRMS
jgi:hypothetical protein